MRKKIIIFFCVVVVLILFVPIPMRLKDGGSVRFQALVYEVSKVHRLAEVEADKEFEEGWIVSVLGVEIYNDVE